MMVVMKKMMMSDLKVYSWISFDMLIDGMGVDDLLPAHMNH
jgi:hypothetical protein